MPTSCNNPEDSNLEDKTNAVSGIENVLHRQNRCQKILIYVGIFSSLCCIRASIWQFVIEKNSLMFARQLKAGFIHAVYFVIGNEL